MKYYQNKVCSFFIISSYGEFKFSQAISMKVKLKPGYQSSFLLFNASAVFPIFEMSMNWN